MVRRRVLPLVAVSALAIVIAAVAALLDWPRSASLTVLALIVFLFILIVGPHVLVEQPPSGDTGERNGGSLLGALLARIRGTYEAP
jgi:membrane protein implicated in regulation of membrane protease activity